MINRIKIKQIDTHCYVASLTGGCIVASDQLPTASLFLKAVKHVNYVYHTTSQSIRVSIFDIRRCKFYPN